MSKILAVMVTFRRPGDAITTSDKVFAQTRPPDHLWVVDNQPTDELSHHFGSRTNCSYLPQTTNLGPSGGFAVGMSAALEEADDDDWILVVDDDDPPPTPRILEQLMELTMKSPSSRLGGVALVGALYDKRRGQLRRIVNDELTRFVYADCFGGNQYPMYSVRAIRDAGVPDPSLFFGFEELEFGLRLRHRGWDLVFDGPTALALREHNGRLNLGKRGPSRSDLPAWRRYYSSRNIIVIARRYGSWTAVLMNLVGAFIVSPLRALRRGRPIREAFITARGAIDALRGRLGRTVEPGRK